MCSPEAVQVAFDRNEMICLHFSWDFGIQFYSIDCVIIVWGFDFKATFTLETCFLAVLSLLTLDFLKQLRPRKYVGFHSVLFFRCHSGFRDQLFSRQGLNFSTGLVELFVISPSDLRTPFVFTHAVDCQKPPLFRTDLDRPIPLFSTQDLGFRTSLYVLLEEDSRWARFF